MAAAPAIVSRGSHFHVNPVQASSWIGFRAIHVNHSGLLDGTALVRQVNIVNQISTHYCTPPCR